MLSSIRAEPILWEEKEFKQNIDQCHPNQNYVVHIIVKQIILHVVAFYAIFKLQDMRLLTIIYTVFLIMLGTLGVTAGPHRLWTHRSYTATLPLKVFLMFCYSLCSNMSIFGWTKTHRLHHKYADTEADPHNVNRGFFYAHIGWTMVGLLPECQQKKNEIDMSDLLTDPVVKFHSRFFQHMLLLLLFLPSLVPIYYWGENPSLSFLATGALRMAVISHISYSVNSFAHIYGSKPYNKNIRSTQVPLLSAFSLGEGWHNYHHTFPWDYKAAEFGDRINLTARFLELCEKLGLAHNLKTASSEMVIKMKDNYGDGSHLLDHYE